MDWSLIPEHFRKATILGLNDCKDPKEESLRQHSIGCLTLTYGASRIHNIGLTSNKKDKKSIFWAHFNLGNVPHRFIGKVKFFSSVGSHKKMCFNPDGGRVKDKDFVLVHI